MRRVGALGTRTLTAIGLVVCLDRIDCRTATSLRVASFSEIDCGARARVALVVGRTPGELREVSAVSTRCGPAAAPFEGAFDTGSVVLAPDDTDAPLLLQLQTRPDGESPETCLDPAQASRCIIARRRVGFAAGKELYVPVELRLSCLGIACAAEETCRRGVCVAASVPTACVDCGEDTLPGATLPASCGPLEGLAPGALWPMPGFCASRPGRSGKNGPATPNVRWRFPLGDFASVTPAVAADGTIYAGSNAGIAFAIDPGGRERWRAPLDGNINASGFLLSADGSVHVGTGKGNVYSLAAETGAIRWQRNIGFDVAFAPGVGPGGALLFAPFGVTPPLFALAPTTGDVLWSSPPLNGAGGATVARDGTIYAGGIDDQLYALRPGDGTLVRATKTTKRTRTPVVAEDGTVFVDDDDTLTAVRPDGAIAWTLPLSGGGASLAIAPDGSLVVATPRTLFAVSTTGEVLWTRSDVPGFTDSLVLGGDGSIYVASGDALIAFSARGEERWRVATGGTVLSPGAIGADATLYVGSTDGNLYAIGP